MAGYILTEHCVDSTIPIEVLETLVWLQGNLPASIMIDGKEICHEAFIKLSIEWLSSDLLEPPSVSNFDWHKYIERLTNCIEIDTIKNEVTYGGEFDKEEFDEALSGALSFLLDETQRLECLRSAFLTTFQHDFRQASLEACGITIESVPATVDDRYGVNAQFIRDRFAVINVKQKSYIIMGSVPYGDSDVSRAAFKKARQALIDDFYPNSDVLKVSGYFEGGNTLFIPGRDGVSQPLFLHGLDPVGHYHSTEKETSLNAGITRGNGRVLPRGRGWNASQDVRNRFFKVSPTRTTTSLHETLAAIGVRALGITVSDVIKINQKQHVEYYYHLDCFSHILPDGRMLILNKNILSKDSQVKLQQAGVVLVDLGCDLKYDYSKSPSFLNELLNGISFYADGVIKLVVPGISEDTRKRLGKVVGIEVIVPGQLTPGETLIPAEIMQNFKNLGYVAASDNDTLLPVKTSYRTHSGGQLNLSETLARLVGETEALSHEYYQNPFLVGKGGLHCMTQPLSSKSANTHDP